MNRGTLLSLVNVSLVAGLLLAVTDAVAQVKPTTDGPTLTTTQCGFGQLTVCGTETVAQHCTYSFSISGDKSGSFGFNFGGWVCTGGGTQNRYKDFDQKTASGTCVVIRRPPADATGSRTPEDDSDWFDDGEESC